MKSVDFFGVVCGMIFGATLMLLFTAKPRAFLTSRSRWMAEHPLGYVFVVAGTALALLAIAYVTAVRFA